MLARSNSRNTGSTSWLAATGMSGSAWRSAATRRRSCSAWRKANNRATANASGGGLSARTVATTRATSSTQRLEHTLGTGPLGDRHDVGPGDQRRRVVAGEVVERRAVLAPQPQEVFEALGRHECDAGTAALEQGVGRNRSTVNEQLDGVRCLQRIQRPKQADGG